LLCNLIGCFSSQFSSNQSPIQINEQSENVLIDDPIVDSNEDLLDRGKFVEDIYKEIVSFPFDNSFVFGLFGGWGEGKTSVLNLLKKKFKERDDFLVFDFNPWYFKDKESILKAFYNGLERTLSNKFVLPLEFSRTVNKYLHFISFGTNVGLGIDFSNKNESAEEMKQRIGSYLKKAKIKVLVVIDDIDRLQPDEVIQVFSLVKCNADLKNTIFVLSFDPLVIERLLQKEFNSDKQYIEKIIQMPINLPAIPRESIGNFLINEINELLKRMSISDDKKKNFYEREFLPTYRTYISKLFRTLRHAKRYINGLSATLPSIKSEVNLNDFLILEVIRIFYPFVYNDIWNNRRFYIDVGLEEDLLQLFRKKEIVNSEVKNHVESVLKEAVGEDKEQYDVLLELLKKLFPVKIKNAFGQGNENFANMMNTFRKEQRITHLECFDKYFMLKVPPSELSDELIEKIINTWSASKEKDKSIREILFMFQEGKALEEFFEKLRIFEDKISEDLTIHIIKVIYSNADKFSKEMTGYSRNSEYYVALLTLLSLINDKIDKDKIQSILEEIINLTPSIPFAVGVVWLCKKEKTGPFYNVYESIDFDKLVDVISRRLKKYFIDEKRDIFVELPEEREWGFIMYQWASDWMSFKNKNKDIVNKYILSLVKDNPTELVKFIMGLRQKNPNDQMVFALKEFENVYNLEEFARLAEFFKNSPELNDEEKGILEEFLESYYKSRPPAS
jgi:predicted KAP-like P-loop ATPase